MLFGGIAIIWDPGISGSVTIRVYGINGEQVRKFPAELAAGGAIWDLKNNSNEKVASGIYVCVDEAKSSEGDMERKKVIKAIK
jgi:hypothetical protein